MEAPVPRNASTKYYTARDLNHRFAAEHGPPIPFFVKLKGIFSEYQGATLANPGVASFSV